MEGSLVAYKVFTNGSTLQASELNDNLMQQAVATFSNAAARTAAITSPVEGQLTYLEDSDRYDSWSGSSWLPVVSPGVWTSYTPTLTGITLGNGTISAKYSLIGKTVNVRFYFTFGTTSAITGDIRIALPSSPASGGNVPLGIALTNAGGTSVVGFCSVFGAEIYTRFMNASGTYVTQTSATSTVPGTWANTNFLSVSITYEAA
jgi:hypothetical protein